MELSKIERFARSRGFDGVKYVGEYNGVPTFKPTREKTVYIGMPFYILIENNKPKLVTGKLGLKILNELYSKKE